MFGKVQANITVKQGELGKDVKVGYQLEIRKEYATSLKVSTAQDLIASMGRPPKEGFTFLGHRFRESTQYKAVITGLETYRQSQAEFSEAPLKNLTPRSTNILKSQLEEIRTHAQKYVADNTGDPKKAREVSVMNGLVQALTKELEDVNTLKNLNHGTFPEHLTIGDVRLLLANDFKDGFQVSSLLNAKSLKEPIEPFGKGALNTVYLAKYDVSGQEEVRILKPLVPNKNVRDRVDPEFTSGIDVNHLMVAQRNIGSSVVADLLGCSSLLPRPDVVVHDGKLYLAMPVAKGEDLIHTHIEVTEQSTEEGRSYEDEPPRDRDLFIADAKLVLTGQTEEGKNIFGRKSDLARDIPVYTDGESDVTASLHTQLLDLQVIDLLCGQTDRTPRNIMVQVSKERVTVNAIDHDSSFGETPMPHVNFEPAFLETTPWPGLPSVMTQSMYDKITSLTEGNLRIALRDVGLKDNQIDQAVSRLTFLKDHARQVHDNRLVIDNCKTWRHPETNQNLSQFLAVKENGGASYIRQFLVAQRDSMEQFGKNQPLKDELHDLK